MIPYEPCLVDACGVIDLSESYNPCSSFVGFPMFWLMFGCKFLYLFPLVTGVILTDDNWVYLQYTSIASYH